MFEAHDSLLHNICLLRAPAPPITGQNPSQAVVRVAGKLEQARNQRSREWLGLWQTGNCVSSPKGRKALQCWSHGPACDNKAHTTAPRSFMAGCFLI